jgi:hypothetical protein
MSRKPPAITVQYLRPDGSVHLEWDLDSFFPDPEAPDQVWVELANWISPPQSGVTRSLDIPAAVVAQHPAGQITGSVVFRWIGPPDDVQGSPFYLLTGSGDSSQPSGPPVPDVKLLARSPKTTRSGNLITISWSSYSYNDGNIIWGPHQAPDSFRHSIQPSSAHYSGTFTTDQPLLPRETYVFRVQVKNSLSTNVWVQSRLSVIASDNFHSVRQFLLAGGVNPATTLRAALPGTSSLRSVMGI